MHKKSGSKSSYRPRTGSVVRPLTVGATEMGLLARLLVRGWGFASSPPRGSMAHARCVRGRLWTGRLRLDYFEIRAC